MKAQITPLARRELTEAVTWIARDNRAAARGLRDAVAAAAMLLGNHPYAGRERHDLARPPFRFLALTAYPYIVVYDAGRTPPLITRIVHAARDLDSIFEANDQ